MLINTDIICLFLSWCKKKEDSIVGEEAICIPFSQVKDEFGIYDDSDPELCMVSIVDEASAQKLSKFYKHKINLRLYDYFIERYDDWICIDGKPTKIPHKAP